LKKKIEIWKNLGDSGDLVKSHCSCMIALTKLVFFFFLQNMWSICFNYFLDLPSWTVTRLFPVLDFIILLLCCISTPNSTVDKLMQVEKRNLAYVVNSCRNCIVYAHTFHNGFTIQKMSIIWIWSSNAFLHDCILLVLN